MLVKIGQIENKPLPKQNEMLKFLDFKITKKLKRPVSKITPGGGKLY